VDRGKKLRLHGPLRKELLVLVIAIVLAMSPGTTAVGQDTETTPDSLVVDVAPVAVAPPTSVVVEDFEYDDGEAMVLSWVPSIDDLLQNSHLIGYKIYRSDDGGVAVEIASLPPGANTFHDDDLNLDGTYVYHVSAVTADGEFASPQTQPQQPEREWINFDLKYLFLIALVIAGAVMFFIELARRGKKLYVRRIAGLEAVDEAIGRATEMGRPILFIPGIHDMDDVQTLAAITILGRVAKQVAHYDTKIRMPVARSLVMTAARETIKTAYQTAGRPDAYSDDMVNYITDEQFGYVAAVDGIIVREKPAACFLLGAFFAESLILAETGNSVGAIQIAGTARPAQLPFFIAACDFTLIGEELFAASAYLSGEPKQLGSLKGQDVGKAIAMGVIALGVLTMTVGTIWEIDLLIEIADGLIAFFSVN
jgi:hypothetical protein